MIGTILVVLLLLWVLGYIHIPYLPIPNLILFHINHHAITLWDIFLLIVISWALKVLPFPFRQIGGIFLILWILSTIGVFIAGGLSSLLVVAIMVGLIFFLLEGGM